MNPVPHSRVGSAAAWRATELVTVSVLAVTRLVVLARLLSPDEFGLFAIAVTSLGVAASLTDLGTVPALVQRPEVSTRDLDAAWSLGIARGAVLAFALTVGAVPVATLFDEPRAAAIIRVLALLPLIQAAASIGAVGFVRRLDFRPPALTRIVDATGQTLVAIALARWLGVWALVAGALCGASAGTVASYVLMAHSPRLTLSGADVRTLLGFGGWLLLTGVLGTVTDFVLRASVARAGGAGGLGLYSLAAGMAFLPVSACAGVLRAVAFPLFARLAADARALREAFRTLVLAFCAILVPVYAVLAALSSVLVSDVMGPRWTGAAPALSILAGACILGLIGEVAVPLFQGVGRPRIVVIVEVVQLAGVLLLAAPLAEARGATGAAFAWLGTAAAALLVSIWLLRVLLGRPFRGQGLRVGAVLAAGVAAGGAAGAVVTVVAGFVGVLVAAASGCAVAIVVLRGLDRYWRLGILREVRDLMAAA